MKRIKQCRSCPWRVGCVPDRDIPNYSRELHERLNRTVISGIASLTAPVNRIMACHYSESGAEIPCAGWLANQIGDGNNIAMRLAILVGKMPVPETDGPQHEHFEETLGDD